MVVFEKYADFYNGRLYLPQQNRWMVKIAFVIKSPREVIFYSVAYNNLILQFELIKLSKSENK